MNTQLTLNVNETANELTMTHEQFASITGKKEGNVRRTMKTLEEKGIIHTAQFEKYGEINGLGHKKKKVVLCVNERDSYVVMAQLSPEFTAQLVDEWKVLKESKNTPALPTTYLEALKSLVKSEEDKALLILESKENAPKVEFFDEVAATTGVSSIGDLAKSFNVGRNKLFSKLREMNILQRNNVPYQRFIGGGYFQVKESVGYNHINYTTYVTGKGQTWLHKKLKELAFI